MLQSLDQLHLSKHTDNGKRSEPLELLAIFLLGLVLRLYAGRNTLQGGNVLPVGYDEFYHMRRILYTVAHFPNTLWFDSYLDYPHGYNITWPPFFDQLMAAISLALGQHSQHGIEMVSAIMPIILGSIAILSCLLHGQRNLRPKNCHHVSLHDCARSLLPTEINARGDRSPLVGRTLVYAGSVVHDSCPFQKGE